MPTTDPADRRVFVISDEAFAEFMAMLDVEPEPDPKLVELLARPSRIFKETR